MVDVRVHPAAQAEYEAAFAWYQARSPVAAGRFEAEVGRVLGRIATSPELYPAYDDQHRYALVARFSYTVVYRICAVEVHVIAIAHSHRRADNWRGRVM